MQPTIGAYSGTAVTMSVRVDQVVPNVIPRLTMDEWVNLAERESSTCPVCERPGSSVDNVFICYGHSGHAAMWRWPGTVGLD